MDQGEAEVYNLPPSYCDAIDRLEEKWSLAGRNKTTISAEMIDRLIDDFDLVARQSRDHALDVLEETIQIFAMDDAFSGARATLAAYVHVRPFQQRALSLMTHCLDEAMTVSTHDAMVLCLQTILNVEEHSSIDKAACHYLGVIATRNAVTTGDAIGTKRTISSCLSGKIEENRYRRIMTECQDHLHKFCPSVPRGPRPAPGGE